MTQRLKRKHRPTGQSGSNRIGCDGLNPCAPAKDYLNTIIMKKTLLAIAFALICFLASAQTPKKVVTDSLTFMPCDVQIFEGVTASGNPKWWIELPAEGGKVRKVSLTQSHVTSGRLLALIERKDLETGRYSYSIKFAEPKKSGQTSGKADLAGLKR